MQPSELDQPAVRVPTSPYYDRRRALLGCVVVLVGIGLLIAAVLVNHGAHSPTVQMLGEELVAARENEAALRDEVALLRDGLGEASVAIEPHEGAAANDPSWIVRNASADDVTVEFHAFPDGDRAALDTAHLPTGGSATLSIATDDGRLRIDWSPRARNATALRFTYERTDNSPVAPVLTSAIRIQPSPAAQAGSHLLAVYAIETQTQPRSLHRPALAIRVLAD